MSHRSTIKRLYLLFQIINRGGYPTKDKLIEHLEMHLGEGAIGISPRSLERSIPHHQKLNNAVSMQLQKYGEVLILDCHSFADTPFHRDLDQKFDRPDFNIGTDPYHTPGDLLSASKSFFTDKGYSVGVDWPYTGSIVPLTYYGANKKVKTIMLEVNRKLYLKEGGRQKNEGFEAIRKLVQEYIHLLKEYVSSQRVVNE